MLRNVRASLRVIAFLLWALLVIPPQSLVLWITKGRAAYWIPLHWHRVALKIFGIRYEVRGTPNLKAQTIYMSNHLSYLDIPLLGSILPYSFVAKQEVSGWPLFNILANLQQTTYIERKKTRIADAKSEMERRLAAGESLIIFPEGTSTSGILVKPFKTSLFELAKSGGHPLDIQPVTIAVVEIDGTPPRTQDENNVYAWPLEMETSLHEHLFKFARTSGAKLVVTFHDPIRADAGSNRKVLAKACHDSVSNGLDATRTAAAA